jgi:hypothetical protein
LNLRGIYLWAGAALVGSAAQAATVVSNWTSASSGVWDSDSNWTNVPTQGGFPNNGNGGVPTYDAVVNATGAFYAVNLATNVTVEDLQVSSAGATINHTAGTLTATGAIDLSAGTYSLNGGTISNTTINVSGSGTLSAGAYSYNMLSGVTVNGDLTLDTENARTQIGPGTTFTTARLAANAAELGFVPGSTLKGNIVFEGTASGNRYIGMTGVPGTVTIAPGSIVRTETATTGNAIIGTGNNYFGAMTLVNQGTISSQVSGRTVTLNPTNFTNSGGPNPGTLLASNGGVLTISAPNWSNAGNINVNGTVNLGGNFNNTGNINVTGGSTAYFGGPMSDGTWSNTGNISVTGGSRVTFGGT